MAVRTLPNLQPVVDAHKHVALLWDERLTGRAWLAVGAAKSILVDVPQAGAWTLWDRFVADATAREAWTVGWLGYDLHSCLGMTQGETPDAPRNATPEHPGGFPSLHWWEPEFLLAWAPGELEPSVVRGGSLPWAPDVMACLDAPSSKPQDSAALEGDWQPLTPGWDRKTYLDKFDAVQAALKRGDIYEMNLCMPWQGKAPVRRVGRCSSVWPRPRRRRTRPTSRLATTASCAQAQSGSSKNEAKPFAANPSKAPCDAEAPLKKTMP